MPINTLPPAPHTSRPSTFSPEMDAFNAALVGLVIELNAMGALLAQSLSGTSSASLLIGMGAKSLTVQTGQGYAPGMEVIIAYTTTPTNRMVGTVTSYDTGTGALVVSVTSTGGSGTYAVWSISPTTVANFNGQAFTNLTLSGPVTETPYALSGTDVNPVNGTIQSKTLSGTWTVTSSVADGQSVLLHITKGANSIVWPTMVWAYGAPTLSSTVVSAVVMWKVGSTLCGCYIGPLS